MQGDVPKLQNSPPMDSYDEEAQCQEGRTRAFKRTSGVEMKDGMDGMDVEEWLLKQHGMAQCAQKHGFSACAQHERSLDDANGGDCLLACIGKGSSSEQQLIEERLFVSRDRPTSELIGPVTPKLPGRQWSEPLNEEEAITSISGHYDKGSVKKDDGVELQAASTRHLDETEPTSLVRQMVPGSMPGAYSVAGWFSRERRGSSFLSQLEVVVSAIDQTTSAEADDHGTKPLSHVFDAELSRPRDEHMVIEGVKTMGPRQRRFCIILGWLGLASVLAVAVAMITKRLTSSSSLLAVNATKIGSPNLPMVPESPEGFETLAPTSSLFEENMNWTVADAILYAANGGPSITIVPASYLFLSMVNKTDTNFTFFGIKLGESVLDGVNSSLITKMVSLLWSGHALDIIEGYTVQGEALALEDLHDGMVLPSVAGYPLTVQLDPFRVNNVTISMERDLNYKNGILHNFDRYPVPLVHWIGKSTLDVLLETNDQRNGDLSDFIALIDELPDLKIQLKNGLPKGMTLFVPTNDALATVVPNLLTSMSQSQETTNSTLRQLVLNHVVHGNFARRCWWIVPTGTHVSDTELMLTSQAGQVLELNITEVVTINGNVKIIREDVYSEHGIIQIIDKPLLLLAAT